MRKTLAIALAIVALTGMSFAELNNVTTGGSIYILSEYSSPEVVRGGTLGGYSAMDAGDSATMTTQWTRLNVGAEFSDNVSACIELDSINVWGNGQFRSAYLTGVDGVARATDVEVYQAYIEANELYGYPLSAKIGRQEVVLGSEFLVGNGEAIPTGLSFDGIRLTYAVDTFTVDALAMKLAEASPAEEDGDIDMYGIYASYLGLEDITIDAYWLLIRDAVSRDTDTGLVGEWIEDVFGWDEMDPSYLHTVGARIEGTYGAIDYEAELAYQFGEADAAGILFGDDDADFDEFAFTLEAGYTFDIEYQPRVYLGLTYLGGEDGRDLGLLEAINMLLPWGSPDSSLSFNTLFSDVNYSTVLFGGSWTDLSNLWILSTGVSASIRENLSVSLDLAYMEVVEETTLVVIPVLWEVESDDQLGWQLCLGASYDYSDDVNVSVGWTHLFADEGIEDGNFVGSNGTVPLGGVLGPWIETNDDDADYLYADITVKF